MTKPARDGRIGRLAQALPAVTHVVQWGGTDVYKVGGKMFAAYGIGHEGGLSIKVPEVAYEVLTESGEARPAPYLARAKWVSFSDPKKVDGKSLKGLIVNAHALVSARLTRKLRKELGLEDWAP